MSSHCGGSPASSRRRAHSPECSWPTPGARRAPGGPGSASMAVCRSLPAAGPRLARRPLPSRLNMPCRRRWTTPASRASCRRSSRRPSAHWQPASRLPRYMRPMATCCISFFRRYPISGRIVTAARSTTVSACCWRLRRLFARSGPRNCRCSSASRQQTGSMMAGMPTKPSNSRGSSGKLAST